MSGILASAIFTVFVIGLLMLDLVVFHRRAHKESFREALVWSAFWIALSLAFNLFIYFWQGPQAGLEFLTGYILEKSLSMDNLFVFALIFGYMAVPAEDQHRALFWGVLGALVMRGGFIAAGVALITHFHWILYVFGAFLVMSGIRFLLQKEHQVHPERNPILRLARRLFPVTKDFEGAAMFVRRNGRIFATPLLLVLLMIETTDIVFAVDSIPAVFAVTENAFIVYSSNVLAILGLRALYFVLAGALTKFKYLRAGLSLVLIFVGAKMLAMKFYRLPTVISLVAIVAILAVAILFSLWTKPEQGTPQRTE
jgi:TerC family integral membrane protein